MPISTTLADSDRKLLPSDWPAKGQVIKACCFNIVDDGETTQGNMADLTAKVLDVEVGYHGKLINQFAKVRPSSSAVANADDVAAQHWRRRRRHQRKGETPSRPSWSG